MQCELGRPRRLKTKDVFLATFFICCMTIVTLLFYVFELGQRTLNIVIIQSESDAYAPRQLQHQIAQHLRPDEKESSPSRHPTPLFFYVYDKQAFLAAAYSDFRNATPQIRVSAFCHKDFPKKVFCKYKEKSYRATGRFMNYSNRTLAQWRSTYLTCDILGLQTTSSIVLGNEKDTLNDVVLPVHASDSHQPKQSLGICVKGGYGSPDPIRLIEWMEFNRLLGVSHVIIYNASLTGDVSKVFDYYINQGRLTVIADTFRYNLVKHDPSFQSLFDNFDATASTGNEPHPQTQLLSLQDCFQRFRSRFDYILVIDIDELLIPTEASTLPEMTAKLRSSYPSSTAFSFLAAEYLENFGSSNQTGVTFAHALAFTRHSNLSYAQVKTIHSTEDTVAINWHRRLLPKANFTAVGRNHGWLHHYRTKCKSKYCSAGQVTDDGDTRVGRYATQLINNMRSVLEALKFIDEDVFFQ